MTDRVASETSLGIRRETAPTAGRVAGSAADELQHTVRTGGASSAGSRRTTASQNILTSRESGNNLPRFLVVKRKDGDFLRESPFVIDREIREKVGIVKSVRKIREGLIVETQSEYQSRRLLELKNFRDYEIEVTEHTTLNIVKGVVTCRDLLNCSLEEIVEQLSDQGVVEAKRISTRREGMLQETASLILTFKRLTLPERIRAGIYQSLPVRPYIPAPLRCFKCQRFGHTSGRCDKPTKCVCGRAIHEGSPCEEPMICPNCEGNHSARSKHCLKYKEELEIQRIKTIDKIPFAEARRKVRSTNPSMSVTYAQAVRTPTSSLEVQNIVDKLVPEIKKICQQMMRGSIDERANKSFAKPQGRVPKPASSIAMEQVSDTSSAANPTQVDKRKRGQMSSKSVSEISDSEESILSSQPSQGEGNVKKKKPGWKKGRPRKPPAENTKQEEIPPTSVI